MVLKLKLLLLLLFSSIVLAHRLYPSQLTQIVSLRGGEDEYDEDEEYSEDEEDDNIEFSFFSATKKSSLNTLWEKYGRNFLEGFMKRAEVARERAVREQYIEDFNARQISAGIFCRACMILPIDDLFDLGGSTSIIRDKLQYSDRCFLPQSISAVLMERRIEVPWQFQIKTIPQTNDLEESAQSFNPLSASSVYCSPMDFRAPENFIFVPKWMMHHLGIQPFSLVLLSWVRLRDGVSIKLRPKQKSFHKLPNPRIALESELKYYSSATASTTISIRHNNKQYDFFVDSCVGKDGSLTEFNPELCDAVSIQDADVSLDLLS